MSSSHRHADHHHRFPIGSRTTLAMIADNPYPIFAEMQHREPISWIDDVGLWFVTRRADILAILGDPDNFTVVSPHSLLDATFGTMMLSSDGAAQQRHRRPFLPPFAPRKLRQIAPQIIQETANALIDRFVDKGTVDIDAAFSEPLALAVVTRVLGLPIDDYEQIRRWYVDFADALATFANDDAVRGRGLIARDEFGDYVIKHLKFLQSNPNESLLSAVLADAENDLGLEEIISDVMVIIFGGLETTAAMLSNTLWALLQHPDQLQTVLDDPDLLGGAVEEGLRWESPVQTCTRHTTQPVNLHGIELPTGSTVQCMLGAANRDPDHFTNPHVFDIGRHNATDHLSFGIGRHFCLGAGLARLEGQIGLRILLERLSTLRLRPDYPTKPFGHEFRSTPTLWVKWG
jgi:cytochrome P450